MRGAGETVTYYVTRESGNDCRVVGESFLTIEAAEGFQDWCYRNRLEGDDADFLIGSRRVYGRATGEPR